MLVLLSLAACGAQTETFWQSDGPQPHLVNVQFHRKASILQVPCHSEVAHRTAPHRARVAWMNLGGIHTAPSPLPPSHLPHTTYHIPSRVTQLRALPSHQSLPALGPRNLLYPLSHGVCACVMRGAVIYLPLPPPHAAAPAPLTQLSLYVDYKLDESYTPKKMCIRAGTTLHDLRDVKVVHLEEPSGWVNIPLGNPEGLGANRCVPLCCTCFVHGEGVGEGAGVGALCRCR
jgi:hypothetical protein